MTFLNIFRHKKKIKSSNVDPSFLNNNSRKQPFIERLKEEKERKELKAKADSENIIRVYKHYIDRFCELAEREVSTLDEWGDEDWNLFPKIKKECILRIARNIDSTKDFLDDWFLENEKYGVEITDKAPSWVKRLFYKDLDRIFLDFHTNKKIKKSNTDIDFGKMSGLDFERFIGGILLGLGYNVSGTPKTGDQGADLIASKDGKTFIIQIKKYSQPVGNKAVQEVVAAKAYYNANIAAVITNSTFTSSAKKLAHKNEVILIDKSKLSSTGYYLNKD